MAGSVVQTNTDWKEFGTGSMITLACTGDSSDGSIPSTTVDVSHLKGKFYLYQVVAFPTSGGTAPDAADVTVTMDGQDLLGGKGVNLIHATATQDVFPYSTFMSSWRFPLITSNLTLAVANQATASANFTILLKFVR